MHIVMNRFRINAGREEDFESSWRNRDSQLGSVPGFLHFALLKGDATDNATVEYISHTTWASREAFDAWRQSQAFTTAHGQAGGSSMEGVMAGPPQAAVYEMVLQEQPAAR